MAFWRFKKRGIRVAKKIKLSYKMLIYDIETDLSLKARIWRCGEQTIRHTQLDAAHNTNGIICIAYKWFGDSKTHVLHGPGMIEKFDAVVRQADVTLGKNNDRFDIKHINTLRMLERLPPYPDWADTSEDLEKRLRKYFAFPSQSLDYISSLLGFGGKVKMEWNDWVAIADHNQLKKYEALGLFNTEQLNAIAQIEFKKSATKVRKEGKTALNKMLFYNKKDVDDTEAVLERVLPYITLKGNMSKLSKDFLICCKVCGSSNLQKNGTRVSMGIKYQRFHCNNHGAYAGQCRINKSGKLGGIR